MGALEAGIERTGLIVERQAISISGPSGRQDFPGRGRTLPVGRNSQAQSLIQQRRQRLAPSLSQLLRRWPVILLTALLRTRCGCDTHHFQLGLARYIFEHAAFVDATECLRREIALCVLDRHHCQKRRTGIRQGDQLGEGRRANPGVLGLDTQLGEGLLIGHMDEERTAFGYGPGPQPLVSNARQTLARDAPHRGISRVLQLDQPRHIADAGGGCGPHPDIGVGLG